MAKAARALGLQDHFLNSVRRAKLPVTIFLVKGIKLQGVVKTRQQGLVAMVNGPDNKGYLVKVGDKVLDGEVIRITPGSIVFRQEVNDPTRIERFREVVKELSSEAPRK